MKNASKLKIIRTEYSPKELLGIFRLFDLFIGVRFHLIIFSMKIGVPTIAIIYDTKTNELLMARRTPSCIGIPINRLSIDMLKEATKICLEAKIRAQGSNTAFRITQ